AGEYKVEFSGFGLTSGIYFYKLSAGNYNETKKMILMK
ncbi:MAG: T9SS type A sorting domain-containing protein, partial [Ignavibacteriaceae bacterium]|nr:T9SS type A sorting domain-containing protein [Ignavibacteriaceae bacterium]